MEFGEKLRQLRKSRYMTQAKLAEGLGTAQSSIASYENGQREPDFATIRRFARFFNVPFASLLPSDDTRSDDELIQQIAESLHQNPKLRLLFDRTEFLSDSDLDAVLSVVNAITKEREEF